jgi:methanogenic corrinoid protein MtbC1
MVGSHRHEHARKPRFCCDYNLGAEVNPDRSVSTMREWKTSPGGSSALLSPTVCYRKAAIVQEIQKAIHRNEKVPVGGARTYQKSGSGCDAGDWSRDAVEVVKLPLRLVEEPCGAWA